METKLFPTDLEKFEISPYKELVIKISEELKGKTPNEVKQILALIGYYTNSKFILT